MPLLLACGAASTPAEAPRGAPRPARASPLEGFTPDNREALVAFLDRWAPPQAADPQAGQEARGEGAPVAVFDWDNTLMKGDIGDASFAYLLAHDRILVPPEGDWSRAFPSFSEAALEALRARCSPLAAPGSLLPTSTHPECAALLARIYSEGEVEAGVSAWTEETTPYFHAPYALLPQLMAGLSPEEARQIGREAYRLHRAMAEGEHDRFGPDRLGEVELAGHTEVYAPMRALVAALQERGFAVWIVSASPQPIVEALAGEVGVSAERVIGIRTPLNEGGRLTYGFARCGPEEGPLITYHLGKRCWINREIFGVPEASRLEAQAPARRPIFVAGDSDTDLAMLEDARELRLVIDRHKPGVSCAAQADPERWLVQPMFLAPLPPREEPLVCP